MAKINTKRAIQSESSTEDDDTPIAKRPRSQAPSTRDAPSTSNSLSSAEEEDLEDPKQDDGQQVDSSDEDDDQPIASLKHNPPIPPKRSIDESSASTTLTTNTEDQELKALKKVRKSTVNSSKIQPPPSSSDDDQPLVSRNPKPRNTTKKPTKTHTRVNREDSDSEDSKPLIQTKPPKPSKNNKNSKTSKPTDQHVKPKPKRGKNGASVTKEAQSQAEIDEAEQFKWWEETKDDDSKKWTTLQHNGVLFPPEYIPLPRHVKIKYDGKNVDLPPESEEVAYFFGSMLNSDHVQKPTFCKNFFADFLQILKTYPPRDGTKIEEFDKCDFTPIFNYAESEREKKKALSNDQKKKLREEKEVAEEKYKTCLLDGRVEKVGNFRVEPPSLFRGRGDHPKTGRLKTRVYAEDITINCSADSKVPEPPPGHKWGNVVHEDKASWLAFWKENINGNTKYVFLAAGSSLKGQSDMKKYEKARELKGVIDQIRADYTEQLSDKLMATRQRATAMYLIDKYALRAGNEKGEDEADTVGCCTLRLEHVILEPPRTVTFDFLGKDSIRYYNSFEIDEAVFKNLRIFKKPPKTPDEKIFDRLSTGTLNKHLSDYLPGLTAKVFRTYNASTTFERELKENMDKLPKNASMAEKMLAYNRANARVAKLCNHQKSVSKTHESTMEKAIDKVRGFKYQRRRLRRILLQHPDLDSPTRKTYQDDDESDLDEEWIEEHEFALEAKKREAIIKKYVKLEEEDEIKRNKPESEREAEEKAAEDSKKPRKKPRSIPSAAEREKDKKKELEKVEGLAKVLREERESNSIAGDKRSVAQLVKAITSIDSSINNAKSSLVGKDESKEVSLGTSKTNYIDPRISFAWATKYEIDPKKIFPKTLQEKFTWAKTTDADWTF